MSNWLVIAVLTVVVYAISKLSDTAIAITEIRHKCDRPQPSSFAELIGGIRDEDDGEDA